MNVKSYLNQYRDLMMKARHYRERITEAENVLKSLEMDGQPKGTRPGDPTKNAALNTLILKETYALIILDAERICADITANIERMSSDKSRLLLYERYILFKPWSQVAKTLDAYRPGKEYELKSVMGYMHKKALKELQEVLNERRQMELDADM